MIARPLAFNARRFRRRGSRSPKQRNGSARDFHRVAEIHHRISTGELYEIPLTDSEPCSLGRNGDGTNAAERQRLQRQGM
jgi:hypothetical protein